MGGDGVVPLVVAEAQGVVGVHRVQALILEGVGPDLVHDADPAALLPQVEHHAPLRLLDAAQGGLELIPAVTAAGAQRVAGEALAVQAGEDVGLTDDLLDDGDVVTGVAVVPEGDDAEGAKAGGQVGHADDAHAHLGRADAAAGVVAVRLDQVVKGSSCLVSGVEQQMGGGPAGAPRALQAAGAVKHFPRQHEGTALHLHPEGGSEAEARGHRA